MNSIVIASIFLPTEAIRKFNQKGKFQLIVVGDKKTPLDWQLDGAVFISINISIGLSCQIVKLLPENHYSRKNIGYIYAIKNKAQVIIDTDDDNIPYDNWGFPSFEGIFTAIRDKNNFVNIYSHYTQKKIWPRGFPLDLINSPEVNITRGELFEKHANVGVWQGLANNEPDVDAIYRLVDNSTCTFEKNGNIALSKNTISPFNSQNTAFRKELFPLLYIPSMVTMRFSDILRGLVAQLLCGYMDMIWELQKLQCVRREMSMI